jgi:hypothetical protein
MNAITPVSWSRRSVWLRRLLGISALLGGIAALVIGEIGLLTRNRTAIAVYSKNAKHFELTASSGRVVAVCITNWWTDEELGFERGPRPTAMDPTKWIGFETEAEWRFAALSLSKGRFHPPLIDMTNVVFTPHFQRGTPLRFVVCVVPAWFPCLICLLPASLWIFFRRRIVVAA